MKKRIAALALSAMLMLALPTLAWAAPSPSGQTATGDNGVALTVTADGTVTVAASSTQASNVTTSGSEVVLASFEVLGDATDVTLTFSVGTQYAGATAKIFVQHNDGTTEVLNATVASDGTITVHVDKLSIFTVVVDPSTATGATGSNTGSTSPQTGLGVDAVAGATVVCAVAACGVAYAIRRKVNE